MKTLSLCGLAICAANAAAGQTPRQSHPARPNIVFVLADDMGIGDLGCYGQRRIETPNIDRLAANGLRFTHHYSGSTVSAPSRCALLTGKDMGHAYVRGNKGTGEGFDWPLAQSETTVAEILHSQGYATACVGKWGLGGPRTTGSPVRRGFDYFFGYLSQGAAHRYYPEYLFENEEKVMLGGETYSHFMIMDKGLEFIEKNGEQPFFVYFAITPPHADLDYPDIDAYRGKFDEPRYNPAKKGSYLNNEYPRATYASMITEIDRSVGRIISTLEENGLIDNTIIIVSSDNGVHDVGGHDPLYFDSNGPFRGNKRDLYEGGVRTPFIVSWPQVVKAPRDVDHISAFWDFMPTVCEITGAPAPKDGNGISYLPVILGEDDRQAEHEQIYFEFFERGGKQSILKDGWKLVRLDLDTPDRIVEELYFLDEDMAEENDLIGQHPDKAAQLREIAAKYRTESEIYKWKAL
jgi:arylsulfatase A-like enzyme